MHVTIIGRQNNSGLEKDKNILLQLLTQHNIAASFRSIDEYHPIDAATDICIFTEVVDERYYGPKNILIPNQEWFHARWIPSLEKFDRIFCKSHFAAEIFQAYHKNVVYTGFTSIDLCNDAEKQLQCFHSQGQSNAKGTMAVLQAWEDNDMPLLHIMTKTPWHNGSNMIVYNQKLPEMEYVSLMNQSMIHVCPSMTEGFGHCINEAKSCGAVVITTNLPPMNEIISEQLLAPDKIYKIPDRLGYCATVTPADISKAIKQLIRKDQLQEIGRRNRQEYLRNDKRFRERFIFELMRS